MRWLIRNTDDHRRFRAVVGSGESRSSTAWMWLGSCGRVSPVAQLGTRNQHRHAVPSAARQRDAYQQIVGLAVGLVHRPNAVAAGHRPVDLDVAEHVLLLERRALERQPERLAHRAVRAVGADEVARPHRLLAGVARQGRGHAVGVLLEAGDPYAALAPARRASPAPRAGSRSVAYCGIAMKPNGTSSGNAMSSCETCSPLT